MPLLIFGLGMLALGTGVKLAGDGISDTADGVTKLVLVGTVAGAGYLIAKKSGVI